MLYEQDMEKKDKQHPELCAYYSLLICTSSVADNNTLPRGLYRQLLKSGGA